MIYRTLNLVAVAAVMVCATSSLAAQEYGVTTTRVSFGFFNGQQDAQTDCGRETTYGHAASLWANYCVDDCSNQGDCCGQRRGCRQHKCCLFGRRGNGGCGQATDCCGAAPVESAPVVNDCGFDGCGDTCGGGRFFGRGHHGCCCKLKGLFARGGNGGCGCDQGCFGWPSGCNSCGAADACGCGNADACGCGGGCGCALFSRLKSHCKSRRACGGCDSGCGGCDSGCGGCLKGFFARLKSHCSRGCKRNSCCEGLSTCGTRNGFFHKYVGADYGCGDFQTSVNGTLTGACGATASTPTIPSSVQDANTFNTPATGSSFSINGNNNSPEFSINKSRFFEPAKPVSNAIDFPTEPISFGNGSYGGGN